MRAVLHGGPYDGVALDHNDVNLYTQLWPIGIRKFVIMSPRSDWDAVRRGEKEKDGPFDGDSPIYEIIRTPSGMEGRYDADGSVLRAATIEFNDGRQPVPVVESTGSYFKCYRGDLANVSLPTDYFIVTDAKDRQWSCFLVSKEEGEMGGMSEMGQRLGGRPSSQPLRLVILHCKDQNDLPFKLSDQID